MFPTTSLCCCFSPPFDFQIFQRFCLEMCVNCCSWQFDVHHFCLEHLWLEVRSFPEVGCQKQHHWATHTPSQMMSSKICKTITFQWTKCFLKGTFLQPPLFSPFQRIVAALRRRDNKRNSQQRGAVAITSTVLSASSVSSSYVETRTVELQFLESVRLGQRMSEVLLRYVSVHSLSRPCPSRCWRFCFHWYLPATAWCERDWQMLTTFWLQS